MRVTIYDRNPGPGFSNKFLKFSWFLGCFFQKLFGKVDAYYGATSWDDALTWLAARPGHLMSIQYWGHGSPGRVWLGRKRLLVEDCKVIREKVLPGSVIWFRACSVFRGLAGYDFSADLSNLLGCTVAGHTRIIGPLQGGLHTRKPNTPPSWPETEGEFPTSWWPCWLRRGNNTVTCFATKIPNGW